MPLSISLRGWHRIRLGRSEHLLLREPFYYLLAQGYARMELLLRPGLSNATKFHISRNPLHSSDEPEMIVIQYLRL